MDTVFSHRPPPKTAVPSPTAVHDPSSRDQRIAAIRTGGRLAWKMRSGYINAAGGEIQMGRWKMVNGPKLKAPRFSNQKTVTKIGGMSRPMLKFVI